MKLKLVLQEQITTDEFLKPLNTIVSKLGYKTTYELWQQIQHFDMFFNEHNPYGVTATYDEVVKIIDFRDEDGTLIFYVV